MDGMRWCLCLLAVAAAGCQSGKPGVSAADSRTAEHSADVQVPKPEKVYQGLWKSSPERTLVDQSGREVKMSGGLTEYIGRPELLLREDMTFRMSLFKGDNQTGTWKVLGDGVELTFANGGKKALLSRAEGGSALVDPTHKITFFRAK